MSRPPVSGRRLRPGTEEAPYSTVVVFREFYGNLWDLLQPQTTAVAVQ